jgi:4-hydroxy-2-oxoheptanedioate aldolase
VTDVASRTLRDRLASSPRALVAGWCTIGSAFAAEAVAHSGVDIVCVDLEHGLTEWDGTLATVLTLSAASFPLLVRVGSHVPGAIARALDAGCDGVIVPHVETVDEAAAAVDACWYPPSGHRSWGPTRAALLRDIDPAAANMRVVCIPMVESATAVGNAAAIAATPGVTAVLVGSNDLCMDLATPTRPATEIRTSPDFYALLAGVVDACRAAGVPAGAPAATDAEARLLHDLGYGLIVLPSDIALLRLAVSQAVDRIRSQTVADTPSVQSHRY